ncbi:PREDICTED: uncharacterized protein LOC105557516 [Vollenhovia emeryi]|uniref:uncharacterized protein LOC105557516 n=1 Tax=Vollenhovia emeryi TaxID=411798 RepID=UPI0005F4B26B|nr:PREDICTED: uncharacterized protein LOC105557516 [Vollenhovia emeryi]
MICQPCTFMQCIIHNLSTRTNSLNVLIGYRIQCFWTQRAHCRSGLKLAELETCTGTQSDTDSDIEVVEKPGEISDTPESETKELVDEKLLNENESDKDRPISES